MRNISLTGRNVLVIDDSMVDLQLISLILQKNNFNVLKTSSGNEGYEIAIRHKPDLILLDVLMPDMNGYDVCRMIKGHPETADIPVIFITASNESQSMIEGFQAGAVDYVTKPFNKVELLARVGIHMELKLSLEEIEEKERNYRLLFNNMTNGFALFELVYDEKIESDNLKFISINPAFENMTGLNDSAVAGKMLSDVLPEPDSDAMRRYGTIALTGEDLTFDYYLQKINKYFNIVAFSPKYRQAAVIITDITIKKIAEMKMKEYNDTLERLVDDKTRQLALSLERERSLTKNLQDALQKEKELGDLKTRFVSMASHEFKTPLTTIMSACDILILYRSKYTEDKITEKLKGIKNEVIHMTRMIEDVLHISRPLDKERPMMLDTVHVKNFIDTIVYDFEVTSGGKNHLITEIVEEISISTDYVRLKMILTNLISNAIKYSPGGSDIIIKAVPYEAGVRISVRDFGIGIPHEQADRLFEPFHRFSNVGTIKGTGLGLSITKREANILGGDIIYNSEVDPGTEFIVLIPDKKNQS